MTCDVNCWYKNSFYITSGLMVPALLVFLLKAHC
jgi:hypothetical protein